MQKRVSFYIDGSNLYFSLKSYINFKVDLIKLCDKIAGDSEVISINYYISPVDQLAYPERYINQQKFLEFLKSQEKVKLVLGRLEKRQKNGVVYYVEKATDINLALDLVLDAQKDLYDVAYLISNDGDFSGAVSSAIGFKKEVIYVAIGCKKHLSFHLKSVSSKTIYPSAKFLSELSF